MTAQRTRDTQVILGVIVIGSLHRNCDVSSFSAHVADNVVSISLSRTQQVRSTPSMLKVYSRERYSCLRLSMCLCCTTFVPCAQNPFSRCTQGMLTPVHVTRKAQPAARPCMPIRVQVDEASGRVAFELQCRSSGRWAHTHNYTCHLHIAMAAEQHMARARLCRPVWQTSADA